MADLQFTIDLQDLMTSKLSALQTQAEKLEATLKNMSVNGGAGGMSADASRAATIKAESDANSLRASKNRAAERLRNTNRINELTKLNSDEIERKGIASARFINELKEKSALKSAEIQERAALRSAEIEKSAEIQSASRISSQFSSGINRMGNMAMMGLLMGGMAASSILKNVISGGQELSLTKSSILALDKGNDTLYNKGTEYAKNSMFGLGVFKNIKQMEAYGFKPNDIMPMIKALGNVSMGDEEKFGRLAYATSELAAGQVTRRQMRQLSMAGLPEEDIAKQLNMSVKELNGKIKKQTISGDKLNDAIVKMVNDPKSRFYNIQEKLMDTPAGRMKQLETNWTLMKDNIGMGILATDGFKHFLDSVLGATETGSDLMPKLIHLGSDIFDWLSGWVDSITNFFKTTDFDTIESGFKVLLDIAEMFLVLGGVNKIAGLAGALSGGIGAGALAIPGVGEAAMVIGIAYFTEKAINDMSKSWVKAEPLGQKRGVVDKVLDEFNATNYSNSDAGRINEFLKNPNSKFLGILPNLNAGQIKGSADRYKQIADKYFLGDESKVTFDNNGNLYSDDVYTKLSKQQGNYGYKTPAEKEFAMQQAAFRANHEELKRERDEKSTKFTTEEDKITGSRTTNINIKMEALVKGLSIACANLKEGTDEIVNAVVLALSDALNTAQGMAAHTTQ